MAEKNLESKKTSLEITPAKDFLTDQLDEINLDIRQFEFGTSVRLHWVNQKTKEVGYTEISYEVYNEKFKTNHRL